MKIKSKDIYFFTVLSTRFITLAAMVSTAFLWISGKTGAPYFKNTVTCLFILVLTFAPSFLNNKVKLLLPPALQAATVFFIFLSVFLGEVLRFYDKFLWWDAMLHVISGVVLGLIAFYMLYSLNSGENAIFQISRVNIFFFVFCFALAFGVLWEIFEFAGDAVLGMNMQKSVYVTDISQMEQFVNKWGRMMDPGLVDTMKDLIADALGAAIAVLWSFFILRGIFKKKDV